MEPAWRLSAGSVQPGRFTTAVAGRGDAFVQCTQRVARWTCSLLSAAGSGRYMPCLTAGAVLPRTAGALRRCGVGWAMASVSRWDGFELSVERRDELRFVALDLVVADEP